MEINNTKRLSFYPIFSFLWGAWSLFLLCGVFYHDESLYFTSGSSAYFFLVFNVSVFLALNGLRLIHDKRKLSMTGVDLGVILFFVYALLWQIGNGKFHPGEMYRGSANMQFELFLFLCLLYLLFRSAPDKHRWRQWIQKAWVVLAGLEALYGLMQILGYAQSHHAMFPVTGDFFNPGPYGGYLAIGFPILLKQWLDTGFSGSKARKYWNGIVYLCGMLIILVLPSTLSRASWIALIAGSLCTLWLHKETSLRIQTLINKIKPLKNLLYAGSILVFSALFAGMITLYHLKKDSADGRMLIWQISANLVKNNPITGSGPGTFSAVYGEGQSAWFMTKDRDESAILRADVPEYAFNEYIQVLTEWGIPGFFLLLWIIFFAFRPIWSSRFRLNRTANAGIMGALAAFCCFAAFSYPFRVIPLAVLWILLLSLSASSQELSLQKKSPCRARFLAILGLLPALFLLRAQIEKQKAFREWRTASYLYKAAHYAEAAVAYAPWEKILRDQKDFLFEYGQALSKSGNPQAGNDIFKQALLYSSDPMFYNCMGNNYKDQGNYLQAEAAYQKAESLVPNRHYPLYLLIKLYAETGQMEKARETAGRFASKPVKVETTAIRQMQEEILQILSEKP